MPAYLPIPDGLEIPEGETFDLVTTYAIDDGQLYPLAVNGIPFEEREMEDEEMEDEEMGDEEMGDEEMGDEEMNPEMGGPEGGDPRGGFMLAIERAMGRPTR